MGESKMKSWSSASVVLMASVSLIALTACEEPKVDAEIFESLTQCKESPNANSDHCEASYKEARKQHATVAYDDEVGEARSHAGAARCRAVALA